MRTRLAPTPSGYLHAGNAFNFLVTHGLARALGATVVLRVDDLDAERTRPWYVEDVFQSLDWLGIQVDEGPSGPEDLTRNWSQQHKLGRYQEFAQVLRERGLLYACDCSRLQWEQHGQAGQHHQCRMEVGTTPASGTPWRLHIPAACTVEVKDLDGTRTAVDLGRVLPDPVILQRTTGRAAYQVASLCDDLDLRIDLIVRGADLLPSTACQLHLAAVVGATGFQAVRFHHHALLRGTDGEKLSKSAGAASLRAMRLAGEGPSALIDAASRCVDGLLVKLNV